MVEMVVPLLTGHSIMVVLECPVGKHQEEEVLVSLVMASQDRQSLLGLAVTGVLVAAAVVGVLMEVLVERESSTFTGDNL
jgi:hypothetical protein